MQKQFVILSSALVCSAVWAQTSSVQVYGIVDVYGQYLDGATRVGRVQSGGKDGSRLGFRGTEDLGGGLRAFFTLEMGINADDGSLAQGGLGFGRQSYVGLADNWGEISLGRQYGSLYRLGSEFSAFGIGAHGPSTQTIGGFAGGYEPFRGASGTAVPPAAGATGNGSPARINNSVRYASPQWNGLQGVALYGAGEVAGSTADNRIVDLSLRYSAAPFDAYVLYVSDKTASAATPSEVATVGLGGSYRAGSFKVTAGGITLDDKSTANQDGKGWWLGGEYYIGNHTLRTQYLESKPSYGSNNKTKALGFGYQYDFSKRTAFYSSLTKFSNDTNAGSGGLGRYHTALPAGLTRLGDADITELVTGIRHSF
jgi:predicted porin